MASPLRNTITLRANPEFQSASSISDASGLNHKMSPSSLLPPCLASPAKKRRRRSTGWALRKLIAAEVKACRSFWSALRSQFTQEISLSWAYTLLLPRCVRPSSSPCASIGTPWLTIIVVMKFRCCRSRSALIAGSSVSPSTPQFHDRLWLSPSLPPSPFASLCFSLYDTRSRSVKPSCATTKLIEAIGLRPECSYRSLEPVIREANSPSVADSPRQKSRTVSRYLPFHSVHSGGKLPTW